MQKPVFRVKRYAHAKYKFVARAKVKGKWKRRYFTNESEALAFAREQNAQAEKYFDSPAVQSDDDIAIGTLAPVEERSPRGSDSGSDLSDLVSPTYLGPRLQRYFGGDWCMHLPFGYDLIRELRPRIFVQLGVGNGESYFAFCQSVAEHILSTKCYGIDTWREAGSVDQVDPEMLAEVANHNWRYSTFSETREMTEALPEFADGSVDLLHIDGAHTYEEAKRDFESWLPKLSPQGIILFHGVIQGDGDSDVWRLWKEIARPKTSFLVEFGHGLGVWKRPGPSKRRVALVRELFTASRAERKRINDHYASAAAALALWHTAQNRAIAAPLTIQIFADQGGGFGEAISMTADLVADRRQTIRFEQLEKLLCVPGGRLRIDPVDRPAFVNISSIKITGDPNEEILYSAQSADDFRRIDVSPGLPRHNEDGNLLLVATDTDPQIFLPAIDLPASGSCRLEIVLEPHVAPDSVLMRQKQALDAAVGKTTGELAGALGARQAELGLQMKTLQEGAMTVPGKTVHLKVFHPRSGGYSAIESWPSHFATRSWRTVAMDLPARKGESDLPTRIDPVTFPAIIEIAEMVLKRPGSDKTVWAARTQKEFDELKIAGSAFRLLHRKHLRILSFGSDPQLLLPSFTIEMNDKPLRLEICLFVDSAPDTIKACLATLRPDPRAPKAPAEAVVPHLCLSVQAGNEPSDGFSLRAPIRIDEPQTVRFENIESLSMEPGCGLRISPLYAPAFLKISRVVITRHSDAHVLYSAESAAEFEKIEVSEGTLKEVFDGGFTVAADDPGQHIYLPGVDLPLNEGCRLEIEIEPYSFPLASRESSVAEFWHPGTGDRAKAALVATK